MTLRLLLALLVSLIVGVGVVRGWVSLKHSNEEQIARLAETESYATRAQLVRNVERAIAALENTRSFWATYGTMPRAEWQGDVEVELAAIPGIRVLLWDDPARGVRFAYTQEHPAFDYRPDEDQWRRYSGLLEHARGAKGDSMVGPLKDSGGRSYFEVYLADDDNPDGSRLIAVIDAQESLQAFLADESPGYAMKVLWRDEVIYQRGEFSENLPTAWTREGYIRTSLGPLWKVVHAPSAQLVDALVSPAVDLLLLLGLVIAVLMGTLTFENWRAHSRAAAAERAERQLAELNRNLEQQVATRTAQLAQRTADLQTLSDSVAHDMRNPLSVISANLELFEARQDGRLDAESLAPLQRIRPAVRQATDILERMLGLTSATHATFARQTVDMARLARDVWKKLVATEPVPPIFEIAPLPPVQADPKLVEILLVNLLGNAIKYTRDRPQPRIGISCLQNDAATVYAVRDNGIGFDPDRAGRMFEAFERLDRPREEAGLGLGLTIAARVVERHGGRIWAEGRTGEYAVFYFTLEPEIGSADRSMTTPASG